MAKNTKNAVENQNDNTKHNLPSHRLQMAIDEVKRGDTVKYDSVEDMMKDLNA